MYRILFILDYNTGENTFVDKSGCTVTNEVLSITREMVGNNKKPNNVSFNINSRSIPALYQALAELVIVSERNFRSRESLWCEKPHDEILRSLVQRPDGAYDVTKYAYDVYPRTVYKVSTYFTSIISLFIIMLFVYSLA